MDGRTESNPSRADITDEADVRTLVGEFYRRAFADDLLGPVFVDIAHMDLAVHLPIITDFWHTVLFRSGRYRRNALTPHQRVHQLAGLTAAHFERWLELWRASVDGLYRGPKAELAKLQADRIAGSMCRRITGSNPEHVARRPPSSRSTMVASG